MFYFRMSSFALNSSHGFLFMGGGRGCVFFGVCGVFLVAGGGEGKGTSFKNIWKISEAKQRGDIFFFGALRLVTLLSVWEKC